MARSKHRYPPMVFGDEAASMVSEHQLAVCRGSYRDIGDDLRYKIGQVGSTARCCGDSSTDPQLRSNSQRLVGDSCGFFKNLEFKRQLNEIGEQRSFLEDPGSSNFFLKNQWSFLEGNYAAQLQFNSNSSTPRSFGDRADRIQEAGFKNQQAGSRSHGNHWRGATMRVDEEKIVDRQLFDERPKRLVSNPNFSVKSFSLRLHDRQVFVEIPEKRQFSWAIDDDEEAKAQDIKRLINCIIEQRMVARSMANPERDVIINKCNEVEQWLREKSQHSVLWSQDIRRRIDALDTTCRSIREKQVSVITPMDSEISSNRALDPILAAPGRVSDMVWGQFLTERPDSSNIEKEGKFLHMQEKSSLQVCANIQLKRTCNNKSSFELQPIDHVELDAIAETGMTSNVPVVDVSIMTLTVKIEKKPSHEDIKMAIETESEGSMKRTLGYVDGVHVFNPTVSSGSQHVNVVVLLEKRSNDRVGVDQFITHDTKLIEEKNLWVFDPGGKIDNDEELAALITNEKMVFVHRFSEVQVHLYRLDITFSSILGNEDKCDGVNSNRTPDLSNAPIASLQGLRQRKFAKVLKRRIFDPGGGIDDDRVLNRTSEEDVNEEDGQWSGMGAEVKEHPGPNIEGDTINEEPANKPGTIMVGINNSESRLKLDENKVGVRVKKVLIFDPGGGVIDASSSFLIATAVNRGIQFGTSSRDPSVCEGAPILASFSNPR